MTTISPPRPPSLRGDERLPGSWPVVWTILGILFLALLAVVVLPDRDPVTPADQSRAVVSVHGYAIDIPETWRAARFEGHDEYLPPGMPGLAVGTPTFAIEITTRVLTTGPTCDPGPLTIEMDGLRARGCRSVDADGSISTWFVGRPETAPGQLVFRIFGSTEELYERYGAQAEAALRTVRAVPPAVERHGVLAPGIARDRYARALVGFLEARIAGNGADYWTTAEAADLYLTPASGLGLYADADDEPWTSYEVIAQRGVDANSVEFDVTIRSSGDTVVETIGVGAGMNTGGAQRAAVVRFAILV